MDMNQGYASPGYEQAHMPVQMPPQLTNTVPLAVAVIGGMGLMTLATLLMLGVGLIDIAALREANMQGGLEYFDTEAFEIRNGVAGLLYMGSFLLTIVLFMVWTFNVTKNARELTSDGSNFSPGWSVGWYFIPFANLVKPYQIMRNVWNASVDPSDWENKAGAGVVKFWWTMWILTTVADRVIGRLWPDDNTEIEMFVAMALGLKVLMLVTNVVAITFVWKLSKLQTQWLNTAEPVWTPADNPYSQS